jgi:hypothetical protein
MRSAITAYASIGRRYGSFVLADVYSINKRLKADQLPDRRQAVALALQL